MLRRLGLGGLALLALGLVTASNVAAQDQGMGMSGSGTTGTSTPGTGMNMPGMGMGPMGMPGMGPGPMGMGMQGMGPMGMGMGMGMSSMGPMGMGMSGTSSGPGAGMAPAYTTAIHHPGDLSGLIPCTGCGAIADPCFFGGHCQYMEAGLWPDNLGLHPTTNRPDLSLYFPEGPLSCGRGRPGNPASCVDAPGEWNLRAGMPTGSGDMGPASR
jgi:hypothetical protein